MSHSGKCKPQVVQRRSPRGLPYRLAFVVVAAALSFALLAPACSLGLSEGRVYEMVTPVYKGGYGAFFLAAAPSGERAEFGSLGAFAGILHIGNSGSRYVATREDGNGWVTTPIEAPFPISGVEQLSPSLDHVEGSRTAVEGEGSTATIYAVQMVHRVGVADTAENWETFGGLDFQSLDLEQGFHHWPGASGDLCHLVLEWLPHGQVVKLVPEAPAGVHELYDVSRGCGGEGGSVRLLAVRNGLGAGGVHEVISTKCAPSLGSVGVPYAQELEPGEYKTFAAEFNAVSGDGSSVFFMVNVEGAAANCISFPDVRQLFVRLGGERTVEVSRPLDVTQPFGGCGDGGGPGEVPGEVPCPGAAARPSAYFQGASEDGSRVFFTTRAGLVSEDTDGKNDLYLARIGCPEGGTGCEVSARQVTSLVRVSAGASVGQAAEVFGVVSVSRDGNGVFFMAHGVLTGTGNDQGEMPVQGADNLYAYDAEHGTLRFIADLCSGPVASGGHEDARCPHNLEGATNPRNDTGLWFPFATEAQSSDDGRFLVFATYAQLISRGLQADTDTAKDVYRYDVLTGRLDRVSLGVEGADANGNDSASEATIVPDDAMGSGQVASEHNMNSRAVSDDGSRIVFSSSGPLSAGAINGLSNVYIWREEPGQVEGSVSMVSTGSSLTNDINPVITASGRDVFFSTSQGLVPVDTEHDVDVYDARIGGGFPPSGAERQQCSSDACQGPLTNPAPLLIPGSVSQAAGGNFTPVTVKTLKGKIRSRRKSKRKHSHGHRRDHRAHKTTAGRRGQ